VIIALCIIAFAVAFIGLPAIGWMIGQAFFGDKD
jgi:hypothetical protein